MKYKNNQRIDLTADFQLTKKQNLQHGEIEAVISNDAVDRHGESVKLEGIDLKQIKKNPVVLWAHDYSSLPIGRLTRIWKSAGNLMGRMKLAVESYDFANTVYRLIQENVINAVSIGGIVKQWSEDFSVIEKMEMMELSVVPVGAQRDALIVGKELGMKPEIFKRQYEDFVRCSLTNKLKELPKDQIKLHIDSLKTLTSALESSYSVVSDKSEKPKKVIRRLVLARQAAKQCDKQSELIIAEINNLLNS